LQLEKDVYDANDRGMVVVMVVKVGEMRSIYKVPKSYLSEKIPFIIGFH